MTTAQATTQSQYTANGMTVVIDWHAADWNPMAVTLKAIVSTDEGVREHILTGRWRNCAAPTQATCTT